MLQARGISHSQAGPRPEAPSPAFPSARRWQRAARRQHRAVLVRAAAWDRLSALGLSSARFVLASVRGWPAGRLPLAGRGGMGAGSAAQSSAAPPSPVLAVAQQQSVMLTLVSFAVTRRAYSRLTSQWSREYAARTGVTVKFRQSFGGSGTQARAVMDGLPGDIVALALPLDVMKIAQAGLVRSDWAAQFPHGSVVTESVVALVSRRGNPKNIRSWEDLARPDVSVIMANPRTAGVARWIFFALWGAFLDRGEESAKSYVAAVLDRVLIQPRDAREASDVFYKQHKGDVLLTYENEAIFTNLVAGPRGSLPYATPDVNVRIQCPVALVDANLDAQGPVARRAAAAFVASLWEERAQSAFFECGFRGRPRGREADAKESTMPSVRGLWTVEERLGGWEGLQERFFDDAGIYSVIQRQVSQKQLERRAGRAG